MALKQIKNKIIATKKTGKVTKAMEAVSAVKMRKSQERAFKARAYATSAMRILSNIARARVEGLDAYTKPRMEGRALVIIVTSDKGLAGSVNSAVLKRAAEFVRTGADAIAIGRKAAEFYRREGTGELLGEYINVADEVTEGDVRDIVTTVLEGWNANTHSAVHVVYQNFISTFEQEPTVRQMLPLNGVALKEMVAGIRPAKGKFAAYEPMLPESAAIYTIEPSPEEVLRSLIPQLLSIMVFHALIESKASEHSARMVAMKNATDKAKEMTHSLTLVFNKERQAAITAEVSEITGGIEALKE